MEDQKYTPIYALTLKRKEGDSENNPNYETMEEGTCILTDLDKEVVIQEGLRSMRQRGETTMTLENEVKKE